MTEKGSTSYGRGWKKWLAIYAGVAIVAYLVIYPLFFTGGGAGGGGSGLY